MLSLCLEGWGRVGKVGRKDKGWQEACVQVRWGSGSRWVLGGTGLGSVENRGGGLPFRGSRSPFLSLSLSEGERG